MDILVPTSGGGPGVVVGHAWWGLNATIRDYGARLADAGFVVALPDLFEGRIAASVAAAEMLVGKDWNAEAKLRQAIATLAAHPAVSGGRLGTVGFSYSGWTLVGLASDGTLPLAGTVVYYATRIPDAKHGPVLAHLAESDPFESEESMATMAAALAMSGTPNAAYRYPGTTHWFAESDRPEYVAAAAELAFARTVSFLRQILSA